jgi:Flp pilus assembly protein TadD
MMIHADGRPNKTTTKRKASIRLWGAIGLAAVVVSVGGLAFWHFRERPAPAAATADDGDDDIKQALAVVNPGYVGIDACAECHAQRAATFKTTRHFLACTPASGVAAPAFTPERGQYKIDGAGLRFEMTHAGHAYYATSIQATDAGEQRQTDQIALVYGSANKRDEMYFAWRDDRLVHIPVAWLYPQQRWGNAVETRRVGGVTPACLECHNTWAAHIPGTSDQYRREDMFIGVTCERCHGPGREHVSYHREHPKDAAHAILHPGTLSRDRLMDVCAQCHGNVRLIRSAFSYRPGEALDTAYRTATAKYREDDTTTNQVQYLGESKCFKKSEMTCITCHDPHRPRSPQAGCMKCHTAASCTDQPNQPPAVRGDCVACHMPQHIWMNSHYYTTSDDDYVPVAPRSEHRIAVYPDAKKAVLLAWLRKQDDAKSRAEAEGLAGELTAHWLAEAEQCGRDNRPKAAIGAFREALLITPGPATRQKLKEMIARQARLDDLVQAVDTERHDPARAVPLLKKILQLKPDDARAHHELGTIYAQTGQREEAIRHLRAVAKCDPCNSTGMTRLAWMAHMEGRAEDAVAQCVEADRIEPNAGNHYVWGMALAKLERWADAEKHFRSTLAINPTHGGANQGLSEALRRRGQATEAVRFAKRAVHWSDPKNAAVQVTLAEAYVAAERVPDARRAFTQAQAIAEGNNPALAAAIRKRLSELE